MESFYTLHPKLDYDFIPKEIQVIFLHESMVIPYEIRTTECYQAVTTCILRDGLDVIGFGWAIENPNDEYDRDLGYQFAFKKAIRIMLKNVMERKEWWCFDKKTAKEIDKAFRTALYKARNKNER